MCVGIKNRLDHIKESTNNKCWRGCVWRKVHCQWECKLVQPLWRTGSLKSEIQSDHVLLQSHSWAEFQRNPNLKRCVHPKCSLSRCLYQPRHGSSLDARQQTKMRYIHTVEHYSCTRRNSIMLFAITQVDLETVILSETSQKKKDKYHIMSFICGL